MIEFHALIFWPLSKVRFVDLGLVMDTIGSPKESNPLLISTGFLKYPLELKKKNSVRTEKKIQLVYTEILFQFLLNFFFSF